MEVEFLGSYAATFLLGEWPLFGGKYRLLNGRWDGIDTTVLLVLLTVGWAAWCWRRNLLRSQRHDYYDARKLFNDLCKVHQLSRTDMVLLHALANDRGVEATAGLFVRPEHFTPSAARRNDDDFCTASALLKRKLFGAEIEAETPAEQSGATM